MLKLNLILLKIIFTKNHQNDLTIVLTQFLNSHKLGDVLWSQQEKQTLILGIVMKKDNAGETMQKIKEHLKGLGITDVGFVIPLRSQFDEEFVKQNYRLAFLE